MRCVIKTQTILEAFADKDCCIKRLDGTFNAYETETYIDISQLLYKFYMNKQNNN